MLFTRTETINLISTEWQRSICFFFVFFFFNGNLSGAFKNVTAMKRFSAHTKEDIIVTVSEQLLKKVGFKKELSQNGEAISRRIMISFEEEVSKFRIAKLSMMLLHGDSIFVNTHLFDILYYKIIR